LTGDIEAAAKLDVKEGPVRVVRYEPAPTVENVPQPRPDSPPLGGDYAAGGGEIAGKLSRASTAGLAALTGDVG